MTDIHRTTFTVEVFSPGPFVVPPTEDQDPFNLGYINYAITDGECIGHVEVTSTMVVPPEAVEGELLRIGNDGTFFNEEDI